MSYYRRGRRYKESDPPEVTLRGNSLCAKTPYNAAFVAALKGTIPDTSRRWSPMDKVWLVDPSHGRQLARLIEEHYGVQVGIPHETDPEKSARRKFTLEYLGACRDRAGGESAAYGQVGGRWAAVFPEAPLRAFFGAEARPGEALSYYALLGLRPGVSDREVQRAYRRLALLWHPDRNRDPDAAGQFHAVQRAYDVLRDTTLRARYDVGMALARSVAPEDKQLSRPMGYRAPFTVGNITATGRISLEWFLVEEIHEWDPEVRDAEGRLLVSYWSSAAQAVEMLWVAQ